MMRGDTVNIKKEWRSVLIGFMIANWVNSKRGKDGIGRSAGTATSRQQLISDGYMYLASWVDTEKWQL